ncbi:uncharacterized protein LOC131214267, partial [Anopheles bellator]|uniref:uncharacterized protein LOC131214267 n=1 Tax=Anopheles bellator TaxID=139047 RepID=UPI0026498AE6
VLTLEHERIRQRSVELQQLIIISNLDSLQNHLESIEEAIILAKHGIPSSKILRNHSDCVFEKIYSNGIIKRIDETNILINDAIAGISSNCSNINQQLQGSFLIQFSKCSIYINGEEFTNLETTIPARSYYPTLGIMATEIDIIDEPP